MKTNFRIKVGAIVKNIRKDPNQLIIIKVDLS